MLAVLADTMDTVVAVLGLGIQKFISVDAIMGKSKGRNRNRVSSVSIPESYFLIPDSKSLLTIQFSPPMVSSLPVVIIESLLLLWQRPLIF